MCASTIVKIRITVKRLDRSAQREESIIQTYMFSVGHDDITIREIFLSMKASQKIRRKALLLEGSDSS